jgi:hypothetical protein
MTKTERAAAVSVKATRRTRISPNPAKPEPKWVE